MTPEEKKKSLRENFQRSVTCFVFILLGINFIHSRNVIHRDLKPENVFLVGKGSGGSIPKVGDFGLAGYIKTETVDEDEHKDGTKTYLPPEAINSGNKVKNK